MRNKIDMSRPPEDMLLNPWQTDVFALLDSPTEIWRAETPAMIEGFAVSAHPQINAKINRAIKQSRKNRRLACAIEYEDKLALLAAASFRKSVMMADGQLVIAGSMGARAIKGYRREHLRDEPEIDAKIASYLDRCKQENQGYALPVFEGEIPQDVPFVLACRNTFNYFHFVTESLCQLCLLDQIDFDGDIYFHYPNHDDKRRPFAQAFVQALFPEIADRVHFERAPKDYEYVLTGYDLLSTYPFAAPKLFAGLAEHDNSGVLDPGKNSELATWRMLAANGYSTSLKALRDRALKTVEGQDFNHLPKRFFVGRDDQQSRARHMGGQGLLVEHLELLGFEYVEFENLSPLEQVALMANAEIMISYHGAGFTNMLFANQDAIVIELGTLQTAQERWEDFWPLAHVSGCQYLTFFGDFRSENPLLEPNFAEDGILPGDFSEAAIGQVMALLVTLLGYETELKSAESITVLGQQLMQIDRLDLAANLVERHKHLMQGHYDLCLMAADCYKKRDVPKQELMALDLAYKANKTDWRLLVRIIWCANRCERPQVIRWALSRLKQSFPERHQAFVSAHEWVRYVA